MRTGFDGQPRKGPIRTLKTVRAGSRVSGELSWLLHRGGGPGKQSHLLIASFLAARPIDDFGNSKFGTHAPEASVAPVGY